MREHSKPLNAGRRHLIRALLAAPFAGLAAGSFPRAGAARTLAETPDCGDDEPTPSQTAGPFFKPDSPLRASLRDAGLKGTPFAVSGLVLTTACAPVPRALLDFWHTDDQGRYDLQGYRLRGHQFTDEAGRFRLETILPGAYGGRARHIHVRVQAPHGRVLTTQLYFPGEADNEDDWLFSHRLLMDVRGAGARREGRYHFVLRG